MKRLAIIAAGSVMALTACSAVVEEPVLITNEAMSQFDQAVNKPVELSKFSRGGQIIGSSSYKPAFELASEECNLVVQLSDVGRGVLAEPRNFPEGSHPSFDNVLSAKALLYELRNQDFDTSTDQGFAEWNAAYEAGIRSEWASITLTWLLYSTIEDAQTMETRARAAVEPCGSLRSERVSGDYVFTVEDNLESVEDLTGSNGFVMSRTDVMRVSDESGSSSTGGYDTTFIAQASNVVVVVNFAVSDGAIGALGLDGQLTLDGATDLLNQSLSFLASP